MKLAQGMLAQGLDRGFGGKVERWPLVTGIDYYMALGIGFKHERGWL